MLEDKQLRSNKSYVGRIGGRVVHVTARQLSNGA
jgi:hypothetical protein